MQTTMPSRVFMSVFKDATAKAAAAGKSTITCKEIIDIATHKLKNHKISSKYQADELIKLTTERGVIKSSHTIFRENGKLSYIGKCMVTDLIVKAKKAIKISKELLKFKKI